MVASAVGEVILINISGTDKQGLTSLISTQLANYDVNILDIGQATIHQNLSLGILAEVPKAEADSMQRGLRLACEAVGLTVRFTPIDSSEYEFWVEQQGKPRFIMTLLARKLTAEHIAKTTAVIAENQLNIDTISRLSGRISLINQQNPPNACVEFSLRGELTTAALAQIKGRFSHLATTLDIDIAFQRDDVYRRHRRLIVLDMDSTLIATEVIDELAKRAGCLQQVGAITEAAMQGELDFKASLIKRVSLLKGLDESVMADIAARLPLSEGAERLISTLKKLGLKVAILSGGFSYFGEHLKKRLDIDYVLSNQLEIIDGKLTGKVKGTIVDGERKAAYLKELAAKENISLAQTIAVGDGANDLPMLSIAGLGIAYRAKPLVKANADHAISTLGLDAVLYLLGVRDREVESEL